MQNYKKNLGPEVIYDQYRHRSNKKLKKNNTDIHTQWHQKTQFKFDVHIDRLNSTRLTKQIAEFYENGSEVQVDTVKWIGAVKNDLKLARNTQEDILDREIFRIKFQKGKLTKRNKNNGNNMDRRERRPIANK